MICRLSELGPARQEQALQEIRDIFFEASSIKKFRDKNHRQSFFFRWCGVYLQEGFPSPLLAIEDEKVLGYLVYSLSSPLKGDWAQPGVECFMDMYDEFSLHLHMNCHHKARGRGVGSQLVKELENRPGQKDVNGMHIITSPDQPNVEFYRKRGFNREEVRLREGYELLFMGKKSRG
jgi:ribosomal protein S18 acetylase RimI-like enzyme